MFEGIEKARQLLSSGSTKAAIDEYFNLITIFKDKSNYEEASRLLLEIMTKIEETNDKRQIYYVTENLMQIINELKIKDFQAFTGKTDKFLANVKTLYREKDEQFDIAGNIAETQAQYYEKHKKDGNNFLLEAARDYSDWAFKNLAKARVREEELKAGEHSLKKTEKILEKLQQEEKLFEIYYKIISKQLELKNDDLAEATIENVVNLLLQLKASEEKILIATEQVMNIYVLFIEGKIADILEPEANITKLDSIDFENNIAVRIITHAKEICLARNAPRASIILAKELTLIGLVIFEKGYHHQALPYYQEAMAYYLELKDDTEAKAFGQSIISLGLQLFTNEKYPMGRDYFNIAIEIGEKIDRNFEAEVYQKQAELFLKYHKYQLAYEALKQMITPLKELPESQKRKDIPSFIRQIAKERFNKNDFHYAEMFYRLCADFFIAFDERELAAETYDSSWQPMFKVRQMQTGIDLARKAAEAYKQAHKEEEAADVYLRLAEQLLSESHYDIALEQLQLTAQTIPEYIRELKFKPLVALTTKYTEISIKNRDIINARELWKTACKFNDILAQSFIKKDVNLVVETIEDHIKNVRKFDVPELNEVTFESAQGSGRVLSEAKEYERAAKILVSFATDFLRKNLPQFADPLFERGAAEFINANLHDDAARVLTALARYHAEHNNFEKSLEYYRGASINSQMEANEKIFNYVSQHCFETYSSLLFIDDLENAEKGYQTALEISKIVSKESAANLATEIAKKYIEKDHYQFAIKYYQKAIENLIEISSRNTILIGAEIVDKGRKAFAKNHFIESDALLSLGITAYLKTKQEAQAAQIAKIDGEKFLSSPHPEIGLNLLNKAMQIYKQLNELIFAAEIHEIKGKYYVNTFNFVEGLVEFHNAGTIYYESKKTSSLKRLIIDIIEFAYQIILEKDIPQGIAYDRGKTGLEFFAFAEEFTLKINDIKLNSEVKYNAWKVFSKELLHEVAFVSLERTFDIFIQLKRNKEINELTQEVSEFSSQLILQKDLTNAVKYLNLALDKLQKISKEKESAAICINACETFLKAENNEVAVSWGLRGAEILTKIKMVNEATQFLDELVTELMERNSIENAVLCYGKIAKILEENGRVKEIEDVALKVMAFGKAYIKNNNPTAGLRLWEVALTIGAIVGEEFTGRLCTIEGQTFYEIKEYEKSIELFKESHSFFKRTGKSNRLINLGNTIFTIAHELQKEKDLDTSFKYLPIAFESLVAGNELFLATEKMFSNAKNFIEVNREKEGNHIINITIDTLFAKGDIVTGVERCFIGAALLISYGKATEGSKLIDKGMEKVTQISDSAAIKHLATVCQNQGIILRENDKLEASHIILASGIGILRTINDLLGIGLISIDLGRTLVQRNEMNAALEAYRNGVQLIAQGDLRKEAIDVVNELIAEGRRQIDNKNTLLGIPLVELSGELYIFLGLHDRIMVISEIFINLGGKMLTEQNYDIAALYFSKAMELANQAGLKEYLPKVGVRCVDFGLKLVKEGDPILGIQFMNAGADLISQFEDKPERSSRALMNYLESIIQVINLVYEENTLKEEEHLELIEQFVNSTIKFFVKVQALKSLEKLSQILLEYGKKLLRTKEPKIVRRILEPALRAAEQANSSKQQIDIANIYLEHVNYLISINKLDLLETIVDQALKIYLEVSDFKEIRKFMGIMTHHGRELCLNDATNTYGINIINKLIDLTETLSHQEIFPVIIIPLIHLEQQSLEQQNFEIVIYARQSIIRLLRIIQNALYPLTILGNISLSNMIYDWYKPAEELALKPTTFDQVIKVIDQSLQLAVITQQIELGMVVVEKTIELINESFKRKIKGIDLLYEILAISLDGLGKHAMIIHLGNKCMQIGKEAAERRRLKESIDFLKAAGRIFAIVNDKRLMADVAIACAAVGDLRIKEKNTKEGLYYYSAALENYELSRDEKSIDLITTTIADLFPAVPIEDGYVSFLVPGMVYANRNQMNEAEMLAAQAIEQAEKMIRSGKSDSIFDSISYLLAGTDIYERTGNIIEEARIYDQFMFIYLESISDSKIFELFNDLLIRSINKKMNLWDFAAINDLFKKVTEQRLQKNKVYNLIKNTVTALQIGNIDYAFNQATFVNVKFERNVREIVESYKEQLKQDIKDSGKLSIHEYMDTQPISNLVNTLIQDLYARKEIEGKYFPIGLFVSSEQLTNTLNFLDLELTEKGKVIISEVTGITALTRDELLNVIRLEYLPQKFQATFNEDNSILYSYLQLRNEVKDLAVGYQEIGNIDINKISQQMKFPPNIIQREIEYLILEGKINPRLVGRV